MSVLKEHVNSPHIQSAVNLYYSRGQRITSIRLPYAHIAILPPRAKNRAPPLSFFTYILVKRKITRSVRLPYARRCGSVCVSLAGVAATGP